MDRRDFLAGAALTSLARHGSGITDVRELGALGDGVTDDTAAVQQALDSGGLVFIPPGTYLVGDLATSRPVGVMGCRRLSTLRLRRQSERRAAITLRHPDAFIHDVHFDGNQAGRSCVALSGLRCHANITAERVTADPRSPVYTSGIEVTGMDCHVSIVGEAFLNTGHPNGSTPRLVTVQGRADRYRAEEVAGVGVTAGLVIGERTGKGRCDSIAVHDADDNGLYLLGGTLDVGTIQYHGREECVVAKGELSVSSIRMRGRGISAVGLEDAGRVWIGRLDVRREGLQSARSLWRTRYQNEGSTELIIESVSADLIPVTLGSFDSGILERVAIRNLRARCLYDGSLPAAAPSRLLDFRGVRRFDLTNWDVTVVEDGGEYSQDRYYQAVFPNRRTGVQGRWDNLRFRIEKPDGSPSPVGFRGVGLAGPDVVVVGAEWQANVGPYVREVGFNGWIPDSANAIPSVGNWRRGTELTVVPSSAGVTRAMCVSSGTPGEWLTI